MFIKPFLIYLKFWCLFFKKKKQKHFFQVQQISNQWPWEFFWKIKSWTYKKMFSFLVSFLIMLVYQFQNYHYINIYIRGILKSYTKFEVIRAVFNIIIKEMFILQNFSKDEAKRLNIKITKWVDSLISKSTSVGENEKKIWVVIMKSWKGGRCGRETGFVNADICIWILMLFFCSLIFYFQNQFFFYRVFHLCL